MPDQVPDNSAIVYEQYVPSGAKRDELVSIGVSLSSGSERSLIAMTGVIGEDAEVARREGREPVDIPIPPPIARLGVWYERTRQTSNAREVDRQCRYTLWQHAENCDCLIPEYVRRDTGGRETGRLVPGRMGNHCTPPDTWIQQELEEICTEINTYYRNKGHEVKIKASDFWRPGMSQLELNRTPGDIVKTICGGCHCGDSSCRFCIPVGAPPAALGLLWHWDHHPISRAAAQQRYQQNWMNIGNCFYLGLPWENCVEQMRRCRILFILHHPNTAWGMHD